jgi:type II secretory pathway component HofQ
MSDALLTRIAEGIDALRADIKKLGGASSAGAAPASDAAAKAAVKAAADAAAKASAKAAADKAAKAAADKPKAPAAGAAKTPGGKFTSDQVRDLIRQVASNPSLGRQSALDILADDGGGVTKVTDLKPEVFDAVAEACKVLLSGEGAGAAPAEDDLM